MHYRVLVTTDLSIIGVDTPADLGTIRGDTVVEVDNVEFRKELYVALMNDLDDLLASMNMPRVNGFVIGGKFSGYLINPDQPKSNDEVFKLTYLGAEEDAQIITPALYRVHLKHFEGMATWHSSNSEQAFLDLQSQSVNISFVGRKWLAVVEYSD